MNNTNYVSAGKVGTAALFTICSAILFWASKSFAASDVTLVWDPSLAPNIACYRLYCGTHPGVYKQTIEVGNATTTQVSNLVTGTTYFFAVTASDTTGLESAFSNEVSYDIPSATPSPSPLP